MHIAQIAPLTEAIPPKLYGGTERVVSWLTEELIALGHEVTLFASGDSVTSARLEAVWPRALRLDGAVRDPNALHMLMLERVCQRAAEFDFLHFHLDYYPFSLFSRQSTPFRRHCMAGSICRSTSRCSTHSARCRSFRFPTPSAGRCRRHNGYARSITACRSGCWRQSPSSRSISHSSAASRRKRASIAPSASRQHCGMPLKVAAKVDKADREYFDEEISQ